MVTVRKAEALDLPFLQRELNATNWEHVDLRKSLVWIAEYNGIPFKFIALRLVFQVEPLFSLRTKGIPYFSQARGSYLLYKELERYISDPEQNKTGIYWSFLHAVKPRVWQLMEKVGWLRSYKGGRLYVKGFDKKVD